MPCGNSISYCSGIDSICLKIDNPILKEDLETLKLVEEAWEDIDKGRFKKMKSEDFLNEIKK